MCRYILPFLVLLLFAMPLGAQDYPTECPNFTGSAPYVPSWDWTDESPDNWYWYHKDPNSNIPQEKRMVNPWFIGTQGFENVQHYHADSDSEIDYHVRDGWVLLRKDFGTPSRGIQNNPYFILYNRFTGKMRVFMFVTEFDNFIPITHLFSLELNSFNSDGMYSCVLSNNSTFTTSLTNCLFEENVKRNSSISLFTPNTAYRIDHWIAGEYMTNYDPCACGKDRSALIAPAINYITDGNINYRSVVDGPLETVVSRQDNIFSRFGYALSISNPGLRILKGFYKFSREIDSLIDRSYISKSTDEQTIRDMISSNGFSHQGYLPRIYSSGKEALRDKTEIADSLADLLWNAPERITKNLPVAGAALSGLSALFTGGHNAAAPIAQFPMTAYHRSSYSYSFPGVLNGGDHRFFVPGTVTPDDLTPNHPDRRLISTDWNYPLGIFNLIQPPVVEFVDYEPEVNSNVSLYFGPSSSGPLIYGNPIIRQYRLKEIPHYIVNPASELELVELQFSLIYEGIPRGSIDYAGNINYYNRLKGPSADNDIFSTEYNYSPYNDYFLRGPVPTRRSNFSTATHMHLFNNDLEPIIYENSGLTIDSWPVVEDSSTRATNYTNNLQDILFSTGLFPASCYENNSFLYAIPNNPAYSSDASAFQHPDIKLKILAIFQRKDAYADEETQAVVYMHTFEDIELFDANQNYSTTKYSQVNYSSGSSEGFGRYPFYEYYIDIDPVWPLGNQSYPDVLTITNTHYTTNEVVIANKEIVLGPGVTFDPGVHVKFYAGNKITFKDSSLQSRFGHSFTAKVTLIHGGLANGCLPKVPTSPVTTSSLQQFCDNLNPDYPYNPILHSGKVAEGQAGNSGADWGIDSLQPEVQVYPTVLTQDKTINLHFINTTPVQGTLKLYNALGQSMPLNLPANVYSGTDSQKVSLTLPNLEAGVYILHMECDNGQKHTQRIVIQ